MDKMLTIRIDADKRAKFLAACRTLYQKDASEIIRAFVDLVISDLERRKQIPTELPPRNIEELKQELAM